MLRCPRQLVVARTCSGELGKAELFPEPIPSHVSQPVEGLLKRFPQELVQESKSSLESTENQPFFGSKDAKFVVVQFFDYRCGHCKSSNKDITRFITENPDAKVVYRNLAILGPDSVKASQASLAVYKLYPEAFKGFHDSLMAAPVINDKVLDGLFIKYNLDKGKVLKEMQSKEINNILEENKALAAKIGVRGVPAYIINGEEEEEKAEGALMMRERTQRIESTN